VQRFANARKSGGCFEHRDTALADTASDEAVVQMRAAPINPADLNQIEENTVRSPFRRRRIRGGGVLSILAKV
jgi:hypothetical protein